MRNSFPSRSLKSLSLLGAAILATAGVSPTQSSTLPVAALGEALPDTELADMRGKFVRPDDVSFFGITLLTSWQDAQGVTTNARLVFNVNFLNVGSNGNPTPALMIEWERSGDPSMDVTDTHSGYVPYLSYMTPGQVSPVGGLGTHEGFAQANFVAGADNVTRNNMQISIVPASAISALSMNGMQTAGGSTQIGFSDGDQLQFLVGNNQIGIAMSGGQGLDSSLHSLGGGAGQMLQQTLLNTDGNSVFNSASILLAADNFGQREGIRVESALSVMKGNGY
jgi:hypothetical protein